MRKLIWTDINSPSLKLSLMYDLLLEFYSSVRPAPGIDYVSDRLLDIELTANRRGKQDGGSAHLGEVEVEGYYEGATRGRSSFRGRGRGRAGGRIGGRVLEVAHNMLGPH